MRTTTDLAAVAVFDSYFGFPNLQFQQHGVIHRWRNSVRGGQAKTAESESPTYMPPGRALMKPRSIVLTWAAGIVVISLAVFGPSLPFMSKIFRSLGWQQDVILLDEPAGFETAPTLQLPQLDGWYSDGDSTLNNPALRCQYMFDEGPPAGFPPESRGPEFSTTGELLTQVKEDFAKSIPGPKEITEGENIVIQQKTPSEPGLEFKVARMDYAMIGMTGTLRIAGRNMPQSDSDLLIFLICPTKVVESDSDPWPELIAGTSVVTAGKPAPAAD